MNKKIHWGQVVVLSVALTGIAIILFLIGKAGIEAVSFTATPVTKLTSEVKDSVEQSQDTAVDSHAYKNDTYGFGAIFIAQAQTATECPLDSQMAYNPIREYVFSLDPIECAHDTQDADGFYSERGGRLATLVFDLNKCHDAKGDKTEKSFCAKYDKVSTSDGKAVDGWPAGTWTKSGNYLTFYVDLTFGKDTNWKSDYKFLVLER
jgi:hypothetical protein